MATRRCISGKVVESDAFYRLPVAAQALYMHINQQADDDGFINNAGLIAAHIQGGVKALKLLVEARFLLQYGDVYVVKHWRIANSLKNDRAKNLAYPDIARQLWVKANRAYTDHPVEDGKTLLEIKTGIQVESNWNPSGIQKESDEEKTGIRLESQKKRKEKNRKEPNLTEPKRSDLEGVWNALLENYPESRRGSSTEAKAAFDSAIHDMEQGELCLDALESWKQSEQWAKNGGQYIPMLANWLSRGYYQMQPKQEIPKGASGELGEAELEAIRAVETVPDYDAEADRANRIAALERSLRVGKNILSKRELAAMETELDELRRQ